MLVSVKVHTQRHESKVAMKQRTQQRKKTKALVDDTTRQNYFIQHKE